MAFDFLETLKKGYDAYRSYKSSKSSSSNTIVPASSVARSASSVRGERSYGGNNPILMANQKVIADIGISPIRQYNTILGYAVNKKYETKAKVT
tara:strand:+ start:375 stop:656 length:282 start_codon:yes stop_codon:yes gene_type:complete